MELDNPILNVESPWNRYAKCLGALFDSDMDITVDDPAEVEGGYVVYVHVGTEAKYLALDKVLRKEVTFGKVTLWVRLINESGIEGPLSVYAAIFNGNLMLHDVREKEVPGGVWNYVRFAPAVIQFDDDNLADFNGNWTGLAEDVARMVFLEPDDAHPDVPQVFFCTSDPREDIVL